MTGPVVLSRAVGGPYLWGMARHAFKATVALFCFADAFAACSATASAPDAERVSGALGGARLTLAGCVTDVQGPGDGSGWMGRRADGSVWVGSPALFEPTLGFGVKELADVDGESLSRCVVKNDDSLWCWGNNANGQLGDGTKNDAAAPRQVSALGQAVRQGVISQFFGCALRSDHGVSCWGRNDVGELGDGSHVEHLTPAPVPALGSNVKAISAGFDHACALKTDGTLWCWGGDLYGQVGAGPPQAAGRATPVQVFDNVEKVSAGGFFTCAIRTDHSLWCWGSNADGHLGIGSTVSQGLPQHVASLDDGVRDVDTAVRAACAVKLDGSVWCWGYRGDGRLGDGVADGSRQLTPARVSGPLGQGGGAAVRLSNRTGCAVGDDASLWCWGAGNYVDGTPSSTSPVQVDLCSLPRIASVAPITGWEGGGPTVTVSGADFKAGAQVYFDDDPATSVTFVNASTLQVTPPAHYPAVVDVLLINPGGTKALLKNAFTYASPPSVYGVSPSSGPTSGNISVTLSGSFVPGTGVTFGGVPSTSVKLDSPSQLTALAPAHAPGYVDIVVTNPDGQSDSLVGFYEYIAPPTILRIEPATGPAGGGTSFTIIGSGFDYFTRVRVGDDASNVTLLDANTIAAKTPAHAPGAVDVVVTNEDNQSATLPGGFLFTPGGEAGSSGSSGSSGEGGSSGDGGSSGESGASGDGGASGEDGSAGEDGSSNGSGGWTGDDDDNAGSGGTGAADASKITTPGGCSTSPRGPSGSKSCWRLTLAAAALVVLRARRSGTRGRGERK